MKIGEALEEENSRLISSGFSGISMAMSSQGGFLRILSGMDELRRALLTWSDLMPRFNGGTEVLCLGSTVLLEELDWLNGTVE